MNAVIGDEPFFAGEIEEGAVGDAGLLSRLAWV